MELKKGQTWNVLDKGYVKFIGSMGSDEEIIEAARMSTGKGFIDWNPYTACKFCGMTEQEHMVRQNFCDLRTAPSLPHVMEPSKGDAWLLEFLYSNKHMTPFEMCSLTIEVMAPIFVFREWHRHRTQKFNEFSARYAQMPNIHYLPELERIVKQSKSNKQGGGEAIDPEQAQIYLDVLSNEQAGIYETYDVMIQGGVANEVARINTPVSRYSKMRAKTDLRNWLGFLLLRMAPNAQWEIRQYANAVAEVIKTLYPRTYELFEEHTLHAVTFSRTEMAAIRALMKEHVEHCQTSGRTIREAGLPDAKRKAFLEKLQLTVF